MLLNGMNQPKAWSISYSGVKKIICLQFCPKKIFWPGPKTQAKAWIKHNVVAKAYML